MGLARLWVWGENGIDCSAKVAASLKGLEFHGLLRVPLSIAIALQCMLVAER